jgi:hypothetical protein
MGEVYCARDTGLERDVAVKVRTGNLAKSKELNSAGATGYTNGDVTIAPAIKIKFSAV